MPLWVPRLLGWSVPGMRYVSFELRVAFVYGGMCTDVPFMTFSKLALNLATSGALRITPRGFTATLIT